jgi:type II secretory pathway pseudopilin PulG
MAIAVTGLTIAAVAPPLVIAAATRVQNRRAEQAQQVAQAEVDRVRVLVARDQHTPARLPAVGAAATTGLSNVPAPNRTSGLLKSVNPACNTYNDEQVDANTALLIDIDGDRTCQPDFMMQIFRDTGIVSPDDDPRNGRQGRLSEFQLGVRVYSILARNNLGRLETQAASLNLTQGQGKQRTRPLAVIYSPFSWSDRSQTICDLHQRSGQDVCP